MSTFDEVIVHIGTHKTGSTALQSWCSDNAAELRSKGVSYPAGALEIWGGHHVIAWQLATNHPSQNPSIDLDRESKALGDAEQRRLLLSSEDFEFLDGAAIARLKELLPARKYTIVAFFRNLVDYLFADYQQNVREADSRYARSCEEFFVETNFYYRADYLHIASKWADAFGADNIVLMDYEAVKATGIVQCFLDAVEIPISRTGNDAVRSNRSLDPVSVEILRRMNRLDSIGPEQRERAIARLYAEEREDGRKVAFMSAAVSQRMIENLSHPIGELSRRFGFDVTRLVSNSQTGLDRIEESDVETRLLRLAGAP